MSNALNLSDEEFLKQSPEDFMDEESTTVDQEEGITDIDSSEDPDDDIVDSEESDSDAQEQPEDTVDEEELSQPEGDTQTEHEPFSDSEDLESLDTGDSNEVDTDGDTQENEEFDYESAFKKVTAPFKANGNEMQVTDPDDIVSLMQMGANYHKKMAQLKPNLKIIKMLENNQLLDEAKLHNLVDIAKGDRNAIAKLIKESGIDPLDIDSDQPVEYQPTDYSVSDKEYELDQVLDNIKDTDTFGKTMQVITKEWDTQSKAFISDNPDVIGTINIHMSNGVFDKVNEVLQKEKTLGKLDGMSDVEAYGKIAEYLYQNGVLRSNEPQQEKSDVSSDTETVKDTVATERKQKRKAAASPKPASTPVTTSGDDDFLGLSDEEFMAKYSGH